MDEELLNLGDRVKEVPYGGRDRGIVIETLAMTEFTSLHGRVKVRWDSGPASWLSPEHLEKVGYTE